PSAAARGRSPVPTHGAAPTRAFMALPLVLDTLSGLSAFTRLTNTLPAPGERRTIGGLAGSSDAVLCAALARRLGGSGGVVVVAETLPDAERRLGDLDVLAEGEAVLYPPREGFGEVEPHLEVAGERVETLASLARGETRLLVTTARAVLERT